MKQLSLALLGVPMVGLLVGLAFARPTVDLSWSAQESLSRLETRNNYASIYLSVPSVRNARGVEFQFEWTSTPESSTRLHLGWREPRLPLGWLRVVRDPNSRGEDGCFTKALVQGWEQSDDSALHLHIPIQVEGDAADAGAPVWVTLTELTIETDSGIVIVDCRGAQLGLNASDLPFPPAILRVDPPEISVDLRSPARLEGSGLGGLGLVRMARSDRDKAWEVNTGDDSEVRILADLDRADIGGWTLEAWDSLGRRVGHSKKITVIDRGEGPPVSLSEKTLPELLVNVRRDAMWSNGHSELRIADLAPSLRDLCNEFGVVSIDRVFEPPPEMRGSLRPEQLFQYDRVSTYLRLAVDESVDKERAARAFFRNGNVGMVEFNHLADDAAAPADSAYQWPITSPQDIGVLDAWDEIQGAEGIKIGIVDSGIDWTHVEFGGGTGAGFPVAGGRNFLGVGSDYMDDHHASHGTKVAGIIGAITNNGSGISSVAGDWAGTSGGGPELYALKASPGGGAADIAAALFDAVVAFNVDVVNVSQNVPDHWNVSLMEIAVRSAAVNGTVAVYAKGNEVNFEKHHPCDTAPTLSISVGSYNSSGNLSTSGNTHGNGLSVMAPGDLILSTARSGAFALDSGTSFATPHVAGAAALILRKAELELPHLQLTGRDVKGLIEAGAAPAGAPGYDDYWGHGKLDVDASLALLEHPWEVSQWLVYPNGSTTVEVEPERGVFFTNAVGGTLFGSYRVEPHKVTTLNTSIPALYEDPIHCWGRSLGSVGWSGIPEYQDPWTNVVEPPPGNPDAIAMVTYVYLVKTTIGGTPVGWYPTDPSGVVYSIGTSARPSAHVSAPELNESTSSLSFEASPNPFTETTEIEFALPHERSVSVDVYDVSGRLVRRLGTAVDDRVSVVWDGRNDNGVAVANGVYFVGAAFGSERRVLKVTLLR